MLCNNEGVRVCVFSQKVAEFCRCFLQLVHLSGMISAVNGKLGQDGGQTNNHKGFHNLSTSLMRREYAIGWLDANLQAGTPKWGIPAVG